MRHLAIIMAVFMTLPKLCAGPDAGHRIEGMAPLAPAAEALTMEAVTAGVNDDLRRIRELHHLPGMQHTVEEASYIESRQKEVPKVEEFSTDWEKEMRHNIEQPTAPKPMTPEQINTHDGDLLEIDGEIYNMDEYFEWRYAAKRRGDVHLWRGEIVSKEDKQWFFWEYLITIAMLVGIVWYARDNR